MEGTAWRALLQDGEVPRLVAQCTAAGGDPHRRRAGLERLVALGRPVGEAIAHRYFAQEQDVADAVQDALLLMMRDLPQLRRASAFPAWFASVCHNVCRQRLRRAQARRQERSLDRPPRPWWLGPSEGEPSLDVPDAAAARDFLHLEIGDELQRFLRLLPESQRIAVTSAYLEGRSHEAIGRELGTSARAAEGLVYRAMRRLQTIAAECTAEPERLTRWCPNCGQRHLEAQIIPGRDSTHPLWLDWGCPHCAPGRPETAGWLASNPLPLARYATLDAAWLWERLSWAAGARRLALQAHPHCSRCGAGLRRCLEEMGTTSEGEPVYRLTWRCDGCGHRRFHMSLGSALDGLSDEWMAYLRVHPRLVMLPPCLERKGGELQVVQRARDLDSGKLAMLTVAYDRFEVRDVQLEGA
jgi:RNA polymerase sigma factor (sigma-70 family)